MHQVLPSREPVPQLPDIVKFDKESSAVEEDPVIDLRGEDLAALASIEQAYANRVSLYNLL